MLNPRIPESPFTKGHARVYVAFDILYRLLLRLQYDVQYVRNFTDIDDKIINRANERGEDPLALSRRFIDEFHTVRTPKMCGWMPHLIGFGMDYISVLPYRSHTQMGR